MSENPEVDCQTCGYTLDFDLASWASGSQPVCPECGRTGVDKALEAAIEALLAERPGKTICPSEAARRVDAENWRSLMEPCREAARRLSRAGRIRILKRGESVHPDAIRGTIRLASR